MCIRTPGRHKLRFLLLVCLFPWSASADVRSGPSISVPHANTPSEGSHQTTTTERQTSDSNSQDSSSQDSGVEKSGDGMPRSDGSLGREQNPSPSDRDSTVGDSIGQRDAAPDTSGVSAGESEGGSEAVSGGDTDRDEVMAREQYRRELQEQREQLLQRQQQQQDTGGGESKSPQRTTGQTLLDRERERLLEQQKNQQQQEAQDEKEGSHHSQINLESSTNRQQSLYDSGREGESRPHSDSLEPSIRGGSGAGGDGGKSDMVPGETGGGSGEGEGVSPGGGGEPGSEESSDEAGDGKCDPATQADCPEVKDDIYQRGMELVGKLDPERKAQGYALLKEAAESGHMRALEQVAYAHLVGSVLERNFTWSFEKFSALAEMGNPVGQQGLGFMYSTGIGVNSSQAKALLYYTFAALGGHRFAQMTMGYRALMGISVAQSCETALYYYQKAAKKVVEEVTIVTGGLLISKVRLMEEDNEATNVYGVSEDDMIHYHDVFTDSGNTGAQVLLGVYYMFGMAGAERSFQMALKFLEGAARDGFPAANALIGKIYAEGSSEIPRDYVAAMEYFQKAKDMGHADGYSGMGMMYFFAMGVDQDYTRALELFQRAADKGSSEAQYYLGHMFREGYGTKRNLNKALRYFQLASHGGHLLAIHSLAEMHAEGQGVKRNCNYAVELFKGVAERGQWTRMMEDAERSYEAGDLDSALLVYLLMAEMGVEVAQTNAAYILEQEGLSLVHEKETLKRALILWNRSASQGYAMARVKLGDYYYYGQGTEVNYEAAASQYRIASDKQSSAQAMYNLAYMYQQGYGLKKDYHLAKRYYDLAGETSGEAHIPVVLALLNLNLLCYLELFIQVMSSPVVKGTVAEVEAVAGANWDMYLIAFLSGLLALVFMWRWRY